MGLIPPGAPPDLTEAAPNIIDIRSDTAGIELKQSILDGLNCQDGEEKSLPTLLLYDEKGLKLFEEITYLDQYYLTEEEIHVLGKYADSIAERIPNDALVVELGSGYVMSPQLSIDLHLGQRAFVSTAKGITATYGRSRFYWMH